MNKKRRQRGTGTIYLRGKIWWIQYWDNGRPRCESSGSTERATADKILKQRIGEIAAGRGVAPERATVNDLCRLVIADYRLRKLRDLKITVWRYEAHIKPELGLLLAARVRASHIRAYITRRMEAGATNATINRELSIVRRAFILGREEDPPLITRGPKLPKLEEDNARQGFLEPEQYESLLTELPERLKALFVCAYHVGTRKGELRKIRWEQVDLDAGTISLESKQTKGKKPRVLPIYGEMERWLRFQLERRPEGCQWVFNHYSRQVGAQLHGWREACERAGLPALLFHDLRRSAVRNMKRAKVQDSVAMKISGHKTRAIFDRYNIIDEADLEDAGKKIGEYLAARKQDRAAKLKRVK